MFAETRPAFFDLSGLGVPVTYNGAPIHGLFVDEVAEAFPGMAPVEGTAPTLWVDSDDVASPQHGDAVTVEGGNYKVVEVADRSGVWILKLQAI